MSSSAESRPAGFVPSAAENTEGSTSPITGGEGLLGSATSPGLAPSRPRPSLHPAAEPQRDMPAPSRNPIPALAASQGPTPERPKTRPAIPRPAAVIKESGAPPDATSAPAATESKPSKETGLHSRVCLLVLFPVRDSDGDSLTESHTSLMDKVGPMPQVPENEMHPDKKPGNFKRKAIAAATAGIITFGVVEQANNTITPLIYPRTAATAYEIPTHVPKSKEHSATFVLGGLGTVDSGDYATAEEPALQHDGRIFAVVYPTDMSETSIAGAINETIHEEHLKEVNFDGISSGGVVELRLLPLLDLHANGGVKVNNLEFDDTPVLPSDIRDQNYAFPVWLYQHGMTGGGGFVGKLLGQLYSHFNHPNDYRYIQHQLGDTWDKTIDPESPANWIAELNVDASNTMQDTVRDLASVRYQAVIFLHPADLANDHVVKDKPAVEQLEWANHEAAKIRHEAHKEGLPVDAIPVEIYVAPVEIIRLPGDVSHASAVQDPHVYNLWFGTKLEDIARNALNQIGNQVGDQIRQTEKNK